MTFDVEIVLRERNYAVTEHVQHENEPQAWTDGDVEIVLKEILLAIDRVKNPGTVDRYDPANARNSSEPAVRRVTG